MPTVEIKRYTLRIMATERYVPQQIFDDLPNAISQAEDAIDDQLPEGYYCKIEE